MPEFYFVSGLFVPYKFLISSPIPALHLCIYAKEKKKRKAK